MRFNKRQDRRRQDGAGGRAFSLRVGLAGLVFLFSIPVCFTPPQSAQQQSATAPAQSSRVTRFPLEMNGNHVLLQGRVNGMGPFWFTLDTGAAASVINLRRAREMGLQVSGTGRAQGAGGTAESGRLTGITFGLEGVEIKNLNVMAIALESIEATAGRSMDVIIGAELFHRYVVEVDYESRFITLHDPKQFAYTGNGESLPLKLEGNHPYVTARVAVPGLEPIEGDFVIDAGSGFGITFNPAFVRERKLTERVPDTIKTQARGVGGEFPLTIGRIESLSFGRFKLERPTAAFPQTAGFISKKGSVGNIGGLILRRFKVIFDYSRGRMIVEPNKSFNDPFEFDMSGLALVTDPPYFKTIKVHRVIEKTPAAEAGLKAEDVVLEVEGRAASEYTLHALRDMFKKEGKTYSLKVSRGGQTLEVKLKTRRLI